MTPRGRPGREPTGPPLPGRDGKPAARGELPLIGVGIDVVYIPHVAAGLEEFGERYAARVLSQREWQSFVGRTRTARPRHLAGLLTAKEAAWKSISPDPELAVAWDSLIVDRDQSGRLSVHFTGAIGAWAAAIGPAEVEISTAFAGDYAIATAIARRGTATKESDAARRDDPDGVGAAWPAQRRRDGDRTR